MPSGEVFPAADKDGHYCDRSWLRPSAILVARGLDNQVGQAQITCSVQEPLMGESTRKACNFFQQNKRWKGSVCSLQTFKAENNCSIRQQCCCKLMQMSMAFGFWKSFPTSTVFSCDCLEGTISYHFLRDLLYVQHVIAVAQIQHPANLCILVLPIFIF